MWEWRHFSRNWTWTTELPCALGVKAFGPVVQYCLECWFSTEYHRSLTYGLHSKHKTTVHRMIHFTSFHGLTMWFPVDCRRVVLIFKLKNDPISLSFTAVPSSALHVYRKCIAGIITVALIWGFLFLRRTKTAITLWRHKHKGPVCIMSWFSAQ